MVLSGLSFRFVHYSCILQIPTQYTQTVLHTITNPDGSVSIVQVDPNNPIITLPDGTTAHVQGMATVIIEYIISFY